MHSACSQPTMGARQPTLSLLSWESLSLGFSSSFLSLCTLYSLFSSSLGHCLAIECHSSNIHSLPFSRSLSIHPHSCTFAILDRNTFQPQIIIILLAMASSPRKLGVLVAIPIKGRKLLNKSGRKQSPYVQLRLSDQKKRTKASLIASNEPEWDQEVRLDVFQGNLDMHVAVFDEGKKNELIGEGTLLLHEVIDKGELDVWFPIKSKGASAGDVYFELTFYAIAPPPAAGGRGVPAPHAQVQHPMIRHTQPGFVPVGRPLPNGPLPTMYGVAPGPPAPFPGNTYHPPVGYGNVNNARPYPIPQQQRQHSYPLQQPPITTVPPYGAPPNGPGCNPSFGAGGTSPFRPKTQYNASPQAGVSRPASGGHPNHMPHPVPAGHRNSNFGVQNNNPAAVGFPMTKHSPPGNQRPGVQMPIPRPGGHPNNNTQGYGQTFNNGRPNQFPNNNQPDRRPPPGSQGVPIVTPFVQYNYSMGSFP